MLLFFSRHWYLVETEISILKAQ
jgi:hypothetical protein